jgi:hypothetical protein
VLWNKLSNNDVQQQIDTGFGIPDSQRAPYNPAQSLEIDTQPCSEDIAWSVLSSSSYRLDELFLSHDNSDLRLHGMVDLSARTNQNQSPGDTSVESYCSLATKRDSLSLDSELEASSPPKKARKMPGYRTLVPKHNVSSTGVPEGPCSNNVARRGFRKGGRREPLKPEKRQKATKMRGVRACAACYISHIEVS